MVDAGGIVVEVLDSDNLGQPATVTDLNAWIATFDLNVTSLLDAPGSARQTLQTLSIREGTAIVHIPDMKVVWYNDGDQSGAFTTAAYLAIDEMLRLLAP